MNDEVSVAELLEREGWTETDRRAQGKLRMMAVMLAVVIGCGLAAILVHIGSQAPQADAPSVLDLPRGPTGGLDGGGVPPNPGSAKQTAGSSTVVVTNQAGPLQAGVPWTTTGSTSTTGGATGSNVTPTTDSTPESAPTSSTESAGGNGSTGPRNGPPATTTPNCRLLIFFC